MLPERRALLATASAMSFAAVVVYAGLAGMADAREGSDRGAGLRAGGSGVDRALARPGLRHPVQDEQFYFVMPDRFQNADRSNDTGGLEGGGAEEDVLRHGYDPTNKAYYHGGDLAGLEQKLDYLEEQGTTAIWLTPSFKNKPVQGDGTIEGSSAGYHGYWITDFTRIDPHMGTNAELESLIAEAKKRDMKVFFDIITNHTADVVYYEEGEYSYRSKEEYPYRDAGGEPFDDEDYVGTGEFPELDPQVSFPYTPVVSGGEKDVKKPAWLNDPIYYHNRGDTDFVGQDEDNLYGDFVGLDDLFTEHPRVEDGMVEIYKTWVEDFDIDGFRIDTTKHVNIEFWQRFAPEIQRYAAEHGKEDFFMFGEVYDANPAFTSRYTTEGEMQAILDFPFQSAATGFASRSSGTDALRELYARDDYYTDEDSNAYSLPTFLGNHDMGRFGYFLEQDNPGASERELLARDELGHALMYFARGMPVVYYGDEQGFTGTGGDQLARQDMFPTQTAEYADDDQLGTGATPTADNFDRSHPLYRKFAELAEVRQDHAALRRGAQIHRYSESGPGVYAFSRIERGEQVEYVAAANNSESAATATFETYSPRTGFEPVYGEGAESVRTDAAGEMTVEVPPLSAVVYRAGRPLPESEAAPRITIREPELDEPTGRLEVGAELSEDRFSEVTFGVKAGSRGRGKGGFEPIGTDDNAPYRVFYDASGHEPGTPLTFRAVVHDMNGNYRSSKTVRTTAPTAKGTLYED